MRLWEQKSGSLFGPDPTRCQLPCTEFLVVHVLLQPPYTLHTLMCTPNSTAYVHTDFMVCALSATSGGQMPVAQTGPENGQ